jgi:hypothetical protein
VARYFGVIDGKAVLLESQLNLRESTFDYLWLQPECRCACWSEHYPSKHKTYVVDHERNAHALNGKPISREEYEALLKRLSDAPESTDGVWA